MKKFFNRLLSLLTGLILAVGFLPASLASAASVATTFNHIDIQSDASFKYKVNGVENTINIDFHNNPSNLNNVKIYKKNQDGTRTQIPVSGRWQIASGQGVNAKYEYRISGTFQRFYNNSPQTVANEVIYIVEYDLNVQIGGENKTLVYQDEYSYSSKNNVCPGAANINKGIDVELSGQYLTDFFSPALEIKKFVEFNPTPDTFTFDISNDSVVNVSTAYIDGTNSGSVITGGFVAGQTYTISERALAGYSLRTVKINGQTAAPNNNGSYSFVADPNGGTTTIEFFNAISTSLTVQKEWENTTTLPESVTVELSADGVSTGKTLVLTANSNWRNTFSNLERYDPYDGHEITYAATETKINNVALTNGALVIYNDDQSLAGRFNSASNGSIITNTWTPATNQDDNPDKTSLTLKKVDGNNQAAPLAGAEFELKKNGEVISTQTTPQTGEITLAQLSEGAYTLTETKAPSDYHSLLGPIIITVEREHVFVAADEATLTNTYHNNFTVTIDAPDGVTYDSTTGTLTVQNNLKTTQVSVEKKWLNTQTLTALPRYITVELYGDGQKIGDSINITANDNWSYTWENLRQSTNGEDINYVVKEVGISGASGEGFLVYGVDATPTGQQSVEGQWDTQASKPNDNWVITNSWVNASYQFTGATDFKIKKLDENGLSMPGVGFSINDETYTTDDAGEIAVLIPERINSRWDTYDFTITETDTYDGYDLAAGSATLNVTSESLLSQVNEATLTNIFSKQFTFTASGSTDYTWDSATRTFIVVNNRSLAESLTIEKTFSGIPANVLQSSNLSFTVEGPEDFLTQTIKFSDFQVSGDKATYTLLNIPTGDYTVTENHAEVAGYNLVTTGESGATKTLAKDAAETFIINNAYEFIPPQPPVDPNTDKGLATTTITSLPSLTIPDTGLPTAPATTNTTSQNNNLFAIALGGVLVAFMSALGFGSCTFRRAEN